MQAGGFLCSIFRKMLVAAIVSVCICAINIHASLVGSWHFDAGSGGSAADASVNGSNGTLTNMNTASCWVKGKAGSALEFDGTNDYINLFSPAALDNLFTGDVTMTVWVYIPESHGNITLISAYAGNYNYGFHWRISGSNTVDAGAVFSTANCARGWTTDTVNTGWNFLALVYDSTTKKITLYKNGIELTGGTDTAGAGSYVDDSAGNKVIGKWFTTLDLWNFKGKMDEFAIHSTAMTALEIENICKAPGLAGLWHFDESGGATAADSAVDGNDGTLSNMNTATCWVTGNIGGALEFDGTDDYVDLSNPVVLDNLFANDVTMTAWVYVPESHGNITLISAYAGNYNYGFHWRIAGDNRVDAGAVFSTTDCKRGWTADTVDPGWNFLALKYNSTTKKIALYNNGELLTGGVNDVAGVGTYVDDSAGNKVIGKWFTTMDLWNFEGQIDEFAIYTRELTPDEIREAYKCAWLATWLRFDDGGGTIAADSSFSGSDGTLTNMNTATCWVAGKSGGALEFDGVNDYVNLGSPAALDNLFTGDVTMTAWVYIPASHGNITLISAYAGNYNYGFHWRISSGNTVDAGAVFSTTDCKRGWTADTVDAGWNFLELKYDSTTKKITLYKNGNVLSGGVNDVAGVGTYVDDSAGNKVIGKWYTTTDLWNFEGKIDDFKVHTRALSGLELLEASGVGMWRFNEVSGAVATDISGNRNHGTLINMDTSSCWVNGKVDSALCFDGTDDYVLVANGRSLNITDQITVESWARLEAVGSFHVIACKGQYTYSLAINGGKAEFKIGKSGPSWNATALGATTLDSAKWYHIAGTYKDGVAKVYVNGVLDGTDSGSDVDIRTNTSPLSIGSADSYYSGYRFNGVIDQLNIFNLAFTAAQVDQRYDDLCFGCESNPTGDPIGGGKGYSDIYTTGDYVVDTKAELLTALSSVVSGDIIFVSGDIDLSNERLSIPAGVTLAGNRGEVSGGTIAPGALLYCTNNIDYASLFSMSGAGARITGLRIKGPDPEVGDYDYSEIYRFTGILARAASLKIDNCELSGWNNSAINCASGATGVNIHHNYIHHNRRVGAGYGVCVADGTALVPVDVLIEANMFDFNRHSIASGYQDYSNYEARYNIDLTHALAHIFDRHGSSDWSLGGHDTVIHHNTFRNRTQSGVIIRGEPAGEALVYNNWFYHDSASFSPLPVWFMAPGAVNCSAYDNFFGPAAPVGTNLPEISAAASPASGTGSLNVSFSASGTDLDSYMWDFGDGAQSFTADPTHIYSSPGRYLATVTARDSNGIPAFKTVPVVVQPASGYVLSVWVKDGVRSTARSGYFKKYILINDGTQDYTVWSDDVAGDEGWQHIVVDVTSYVENCDQVTLKLRVKCESSAWDPDNGIEEISQVNVFFDDVILFGSEIENGDFEDAGSSWTYTETAANWAYRYSSADVRSGDLSLRIYHLVESTTTAASYAEMTQTFDINQ